MREPGSRKCAPIDYYDPEHICAQPDEAARSFVNSSNDNARPFLKEKPGGLSIEYLHCGRNLNL